jgi:ABC-2 type transport system permease protein
VGVSFIRQRFSLYSGEAYDSANRPPAFLEELAALWVYRDLVRQLVLRDIKIRYKRSVLGVAWTMLNPLLSMLVLTIVFSELFRFELPAYPVYILSGAIIWNFFAQSTTMAMQQFIWGGQLMTRIYIPRTVFAISAVGTGLVNVVLALVPLLVIMIIAGARPHATMAFLPVALFFAAAFATGVGLILSSLAAIFPDVVDMYQVLLTAWYFLTPVFYPEAIVPGAMRLWLQLNPMHHIVAAFRAPIYYGRLPSAQALGAVAVVSLATLVAGWAIFTSQAEKLVYRL